MNRRGGNIEQSHSRYYWNLTRSDIECNYCCKKALIIMIMDDEYFGGQLVIAKRVLRF